jgi:ABC-type transport system involved in multi-copper enzyme maturation permease subunit
MAEIAWRSRLGAGWRLFRLEAKRTFSTLYWVVLAILLFLFTFFALLNAFAWNGASRAIHIQNLWLWVPMILMSCLLGCRLVLAEQDDHTLEVLFSLPGSRGRIWLFKLGLVYFVVFVTLLFLAALCYLFIADISILGVTLHSLVPAVLFANLALLLSLLMRSWIAGAVVAVLIALFFAMFFEAFSPYIFPFLNPLNVPPRVGAREWFQTVVMNRVVILGLASLLLVLAMRRLRRPERLL